MKDDTVELVKFRRLKLLLDLRDWQVVGLLETLWLFARKNARMGDVGRFTNEEIAVHMEWVGDAGTLIDALTTAGWLDVSPVCRLVVHDWPEHAPSFIVRWIGKTLHLGEHRSANAALMAKWREIVFGRRAPETVPKAPDDDQKAPQTVVSDVPARTRVPNPTQPNPTTPQPPAANPSAPDPDPLTGDWLAVVEECAELGIANAAQACESARYRGCSTTEVRRAVEHFKKHPGAWGLGLLVRIIEHMRPDQKVSWPEPCVEFAAQQAKDAKQRAADELDRKQRKRIIDRQMAAEQRAAELAEAAALESNYGATLDGMAHEEVAALCEKHCAAYSRFLPENGEPVTSALLRPELLKAIKAAL
jgi:hypothetical protein